jgi:hypothetical protein
MITRPWRRRRRRRGKLGVAILGDRAVTRKRGGDESVCLIFLGGHADMINAGCACEGDGKKEE